MHLHHNFAHMLSNFTGWLLLWILVKIIAAQFVGRSNLANVVFGVL